MLVSLWKLGYWATALSQPLVIAALLAELQQAGGTVGGSEYGESDLHTWRLLALVPCF
eukprot:SAG22_NODE_20710_length_263_cov_0.908537_1_plen_57_part_01